MQVDGNRACPKEGTRGAAYFLGVISAGIYLEISMPAGTWHMLGFFQLFFIPSSFCGMAACCYRRCKQFCTSRSISSQMD